MDSSPILVVQIGNCWCKAGLAGDRSPRVLISTRVVNRWTSFGLGSLVVSPSIHDYCSAVDKLFNEIRLKIPVKADSVLIIENEQYPDHFRQAVLQVLYCNHSFQSVSFLSDLVSALIVSGLPSALVIDIGRNTTQCRPIANGCDTWIPASHGRGPKGTDSVFQNFRTHLLEEGRMQLGFSGGSKSDITNLKDNDSVRNYVAIMPETELQAIVAACCYCRYQVPGSESYFESTEAATYEITSLVILTSLFDTVETPSRLWIVVPPELRWKLFEILFSPNNLEVEIINENFENTMENNNSIPNKITTVQDLAIEALDSCSADFQRIIWQSILIVGGFATVMGFRERCFFEIYSALKKKGDLNSGSYKIHENLKMANHICSPSVASWVGGSLVASTSLLKWLSVNDWLEGFDLFDENMKRQISENEIF